jgi:hypothetical protein
MCPQIRCALIKGVGFVFNEPQWAKTELNFTSFALQHNITPQNNTRTHNLHLVKILNFYKSLGKIFYYYTQNKHRKKKKKAWDGGSASKVIAGEHANC